MKAFLQPQAARVILVLGFLASNAAVIALGLHGTGTPMGDINNAYLGWVNQLDSHLPWYGLAQNWVYPYPDLLFIYLPSLFPGSYQIAWLGMAVAINLAALLCLVGVRGRVSKLELAAGWLWAFLILCLGPVAISRLDNISVALAVAAVGLWHHALVRSAAALAALAVWIKVWPVALVLGLLTNAKRLRDTAIWVFGVGLGVLVLGVLVGGAEHVLSFISLQSSRGIQIEAPVASFWLWNNSSSTNPIYFDADLITFQIRAPGTETVAALMGPIQLGALVITAGLALGAALSQRAMNAPEPLRNELISMVTLTTTLDLIVFNKVGSPQYYGWLFVPAVMILLWGVPRSKFPLITIGLLALLTQLVYPVLYDSILFQNHPSTWVLIIRNLLAVTLLVYANRRLLQLSRSSRSSGPTASRSIKNPS